jgi:hypothetical protein
MGRVSAPWSGLENTPSLTYPWRVGERKHRDPRPRDDTDAARDIARELADLANRVSVLEGEANVYLQDPD